MAGTAGQTAGDANANVEDPDQKPVPPLVPNPEPPRYPPHHGEAPGPDDTTSIDARGIAMSVRTPVDPDPLDPRGTPGVAEAAQAEADAATQQRVDALRAEADALEAGGAEGELDLNEDAGAPLTDAGEPVVEGENPQTGEPVEDEPTP